MSNHLLAVCNYLEEYLQASLIKDYCPNGLQIEGPSELHTIGTAVSASLSAIEQAVRLGVQALIVHHGVFWNKDPYPIIGTKKKKIQLLLENGISLIAYHLPLDAHQEIGNNWKAARDLGWEDLKPFGSYNGVPIGVMGTFSEKPIEQMQQELETYYQHSAYPALGGKKRVKTAALISGGAHREITQAVSAEVDCFITGSFDEPIWNLAFEEKINFFPLGHNATERVGIQALGKHLANKFSLTHHFIDLPNPF